MQPTREIEAFIERVNALPAGHGVSLDEVLQPSLNEEAELRKLFATDRKNPVLANPHVGLVDVFDAPDSIRTIRARVVKDKEDLSAKYVMPLSEDARKKEGSPAMVSDLEEFKKNWAIFTEGSLSQLFDWNNVVAAGGSVLACLMPLDEEDKVSKRAIRKFYHSNAYPTSDIDLFLWGLTPEQAEAKIKTIYEAVRDSVPWDVTCIRTKHTVSIHSQYPYRSVQIVLRLYQSPAEILAGFDIDAPCCAYDGNRVWANPRAVIAMMRQCNTVDVTRRSPSYEIRLSKYAQRAFEVYVPNLKRNEVDPTIYERSIARMEGLARLLVLEKLKDDNMRNAFIEGRRQLRGRPNNTYNRHQARRNRKKYKGDLKAETGMGVEMNDYDVASLHIPYGPGWDARRIDKLVYQTDLGMNSTFNPKNKGRRLHRHPAFFGTVEEVMEDCCEMCPKPIDEDERKLQKEEDEVYIRGRIEFIVENPGRQSISGSFNPIDEGEWSEQVYVKPTQQLFIAVAAHDRVTVQKLLKEGDIDVNQRDHVGRTSLHVAIFSKAVDIACDLIDAGARISARLADGRNPLHLAAQYDLLPVIQKLLERNAKNKADAEKKEKGDADDAMDSQDEHPEKNSSEDDWSSHDDEDVEMTDAEDEDEEDEDDDDGEKKSKKKDEPEAPQGDSGDIPEEEEDQPDIIVIDELDWDLGFSALSYAILFASLPTLDALISAGADIHVVTKSNNHQDGRFQPLTLCILREDEDEACAVAERLIKAGATSSTADDQMRTILHVAVFNGRTKFVETLLKCDPNAKKVVNFPALVAQHVAFPIVTAINKKYYGMVALLLAHDAKLELDEKDITTALETAKPDVRRMLTMYGEVDNYVHLAYQPVETALANHDELSKLLVAAGAPVDIGIVQCLSRYPDLRSRRTIREYIDFAIENLSTEIERLKKEQEEADAAVEPTKPESKEETGWLAYYRQCQRPTPPVLSPTTVVVDPKEHETKRRKEKLDRYNDIHEFFVDLRNLIKTENPPAWKDVYPSLETQAAAHPTPLSNRGFGAPRRRQTAPDNNKEERNYTYSILSANVHDHQTVPEHTVAAYDELYEACFVGDNDKIQRLCLPTEGQSTFAISGVSSPLNISVKMTPKPANRYDQTGYTPLFAAIAGRRWSTAKLILAIATAQYHPDDENDRIKFDNDVDMDSDSDDESTHSDDSEMTVEEQEVKFIDIAKRPSAVRTNIHPKKMLEVRANYYKPAPATPPKPVAVAPSPMPMLLGTHGGIRLFQPYPLMVAVINHDLEAFVHIAKLYDALTPAIPLNPDVLDVIIQQDQPDILDEYIRRTGAGINAGSRKEDASAKDGESEIPAATNDSNRIYYGLNVHGKKRMDLARKNDPNATDNNEKAEFPLVWKATRDRAKNVLSYLASERPLAAYKFYAMSHSDAKAIWLRRMGKKDSVQSPGEAEKKLAERLGWTINSLGESPLSAAILSRDVEIVKTLVKLQPDLMKRALQTNIKFIGFNPLMLAVRLNCDDKMMDYLLSRNISPAERDSNRGWNIYHHICELNNGKLLQYFLKKLPRDLNEELIRQQSHKRLNTPLHVLAKKGHKDMLKILLEYSTSTILMRDVDGQTPLHCAVSQSRAAITEILLFASPNATEAIFMENSVGNTPVEVCSLKKVTERFGKFTQDRNIYSYNVSMINPSMVPSADPPQFAANDVEKIGKELQLVRDVVGRYGGPEGTAKLNNRVWSQWVEKVEGLLKAFQERLKRQEEEKRKEAEKLKLPKPEQPFQLDIGNNTAGTLKHIQDALQRLSASGALDNRRHLIHLLDVQKSVSATLEKVSGKEEDYGNTGTTRVTGYRRKRNRVVGGEGALDAEEDAGAQERRMSMVFQHAGTGPDVL